MARIVLKSLKRTVLSSRSGLLKTRTVNGFSCCRLYSSKVNVNGLNPESGDVDISRSEYRNVIHETEIVENVKNIEILLELQQDENSQMSGIKEQMAEDVEAKGYEEMEEMEEMEMVEEEEMEGDDGTPWYLRDGEASEVEPFAEIVLPSLPHGAPVLLGDIIEQMGRTLGLTDLMIFDLTETPDYRSGLSDYSKYAIIASGKSDRHVVRAAEELYLHLKTTYNKIPIAEGIASAAQIRLTQKRLRKRARKYTTESSVDNTYGATPNSWVMLDPRVGDAFIHILTPERREELALEQLWCKKEDRVKYHKTQKEVVSDDIFATLRAKRSFHTSSRTHQQLNNEISSLVETGDFLKLTQLAPGNLTLILTSVYNHLKSVSNDKLKLAGYYVDFATDKFYKTETITEADWALRFKIMKLLHLQFPGAITSEAIEDHFISKKSLTGSITQSDIKSYISFLIDSPRSKKEIVNSEFNIVQGLNNKLGIFLRNLFNNQDEALLFDEELTLLMLRLNYVQGEDFLTPKFVADALNSTTEPPLPCNFRKLTYNNIEPTYTLMSLSPHSPELTNKVFELMITIYANSNQWNKVFSLWDKSSSDLTYSTGANKPWEFLFKLVSILGDKEGSLRVLDGYFKDYIRCGGKLTPNVISSINNMLNLVDPLGEAYVDVRDTLSYIE